MRKVYLFILLIILLMVQSVQANTISSVDWVQEIKLIQGYPDGNLHLDRPVTRAEVAVIIDRLFEPESLRDARFALLTSELQTSLYKDIEKGFWAEKQLVNLTQYGHFQGYPDKTFKPNKNVTFAEASKVLLNVLGISYVEQEWQDYWYEPVIIKLGELGIELKKPNLEMTRKDVVDLLYQIESATGLVSKKIEDNNNIHHVFLKLYLNKELFNSLVEFLNNELFHDDIEKNFELIKNKTMILLTLGEYKVDHERGRIYIRISQDKSLFIKEEIVDEN